MQLDTPFEDEHFLINRIQAGDPAAKRWLYDRYAGAMYGMLLQLIPEEGDAEEALVRTFTRIFKNIGEFRQSGGISLFSWLMKMTRESAVHEIPKVALTGNEITILAKSGIKQFSNSLSGYCRKVFQLCYCRGLPRTDVAARLGIEEEQVNHLLLEAMIAFRKFARRS